MAFSGEKPEGLMDHGHFIQDLMRANADPHHPAHFLTQLLWTRSGWFRMVPAGDTHPDQGQAVLLVRALPGRRLR